MRQLIDLTLGLAYVVDILCLISTCLHHRDIQKPTVGVDSVVFTDCTRDDLSLLDCDFDHGK